MAISKRIRFEVFKRDGFRCQYCGKTPPGVTLEVDHINPKSKGGADDINNYITACFDCNRGKGARKLDQVPTTLSEQDKLLIEREEQIREHEKLRASIKRREQRIAREVAAIFKSGYPGYKLSDRFIKVSLLRFIRLLPSANIKDYMQQAISYIPDDSDRAVSYFCGICWKVIRGNNNGAV